MSDEQRLEDVYPAVTASQAFGLDDEFAAPAEPESLPGVAAESEQPEIIQRQYDLGDGPMTFEGESEADITSQVILAQNQRFQRMMLESGGGQQEFVPQPPQDYEPVSEPTNDELGALMLSFPKDPVGAVRKLMEYNTGIPFDAMMDMLNDAHVNNVKNYTFNAAQQFTARHQQFDGDGNHVGGDYYACPDNANRICRLLQNENRPETPENFEYAWSKLRAVNGLLQYPEGYFETEEDVSPQYRASTAITGRDSYYSNSQSESDDDELVKAAESGQMSLAQIEEAVKRRKFAAYTGR